MYPSGVQPNRVRTIPISNEGLFFIEKIAVLQSQRTLKTVTNVTIMISPLESQGDSHDQVRRLLPCINQETR